MGFGNISQYAAADELGQAHTTAFVKRPANVGANVYVDYTYSPGYPLANFYASTPLEAALIPATRGFYVPSVAPMTQHLKNITMMTTSNSTSLTSGQNQTLTLCDYLLYYPFIDMDAAGEKQDMTNAPTPGIPSLPRYEHGKVMAVCQAVCSTIGQFTMTYTNQDGVAGRITPNIFTQVTTGGGQVVATSGNNIGLIPFLPLQTGDTGVQSIESVTFTAAGGGLMALVIVKPLQTMHLAQESRRITTGSLECFGAAASVDSIIHKAGAAEIKDGAVLGFVARAPSLGSSQLVGVIETLWN